MSTVTTTQADAFFATHLDAAYWAAMSSAQKQAALNSAEPEILAHLRGLDAIDATDANQVGAVCEQALFLYRHRAEMESAAAALVAEVVSETVEGLGSRTFKGGAAVKPMLCRGAQTYLQLVIGPLRFVRG